MKTSNIQTSHALAIIKGWVDPVSAGTEADMPNEWENGDSVALTVGDVVVLDSDGAITRTTTAQDTRPVGVVLDDISVGEYGPVVWQGDVDQINTTASVTAGHYAETSTTAGDATSSSTRRVGSFGYYTGTGSNPSAFLFGGGGGSGVAGSGPWKNVVDYGATGDGVTNDTTSIQDAIDDCADYETLFFPVGTYVITDTLIISAPIRLLGNSAEPNWFEQSARLLMTTDDTNMIECEDFEGELSIAFLGLRGPGSGTTGKGIYTTANINLYGMSIRYCDVGLYIDDSQGVLASSAYYNHIDRCWFDHNTVAGIYLHDQTNNTTIRETYFALDQQYGIKATGGGFGLRIHDCSFELHTVAGIDIDGTGASQSTRAVYIAGCYFEQLDIGTGSTAVADIRIGNSTQVYGVTIEGCFLVNSTLAALNHMDLNKVDRATLIGNVVVADTSLSSLKTNASNTTNLTLINNSFGGSITTPASTHIIDPATSVVAASVGVANSAGTSIYPARADHVHAGATAGATPMLADDAASPFTFDDILQNDLGTAWVFPDA